MKNSSEKLKAFSLKIQTGLKKIKQMKHWHGAQIALMAVCSFVLLLFVTGIMPELFVSAEEKLPAQYVIVTAAEEITESETETVSEEETGPASEETTSAAKYTVDKNVKVNKPKANDAEDVKPADKPGAGSSDSISVKPPVITNDNASNESDLLDLQYANRNNLSGCQNIGNTLFCFDNNHNPVSGFKDINNVKYYFNQYGAQACKVGIDVSKHNGNINWSKVKAAGIDYAIIRVAYRGYKSGVLNSDIKFEDNIRGATAAGVDVGLYVYSQAVNISEALEEASAAVKYAKQYKITYPIYFDTEYSTGERGGRADKISKSLRTDLAVAFCEAVKNAGYKAGVYASKSFFSDELQFSRISSYQIWVAHYTSKTTDFKYNYQMWQYTSKGKIDGIQNNTDINISLYDYKTGSNMSNVGSNLILFDSDEGINEAKNCEASIENYVKFKTEAAYNAALNQINLLSNHTAKQKLSALLEKKKAEHGFVSVTEPETETQLTE